MPVIRDAYGRPLSNLRISITAECNYRCIFCHIEGEPLEGPLTPGTQGIMLLPEDYYVIARAAELLGINSFKITGGEPLIRNDVVEITRSLREGASSSEISMTTNGYLLEKLLGRLVEAGLNRINVSIHSLNREKYKFITGVDGLGRVLKGLENINNYNIKLKINSVILKGVNDKEIWSLAELANKKNATLQLIELHPVGLGARFFEKYYYPLTKIEEELLAKGAKIQRRELHNRPIYILPDGTRIEIVKPYNNPIFCSGCTRLRVGPFGDLSPCLNWRGPRPSLLPEIRRGTLEERIIKAAKLLLKVNTWRKPYFMVKINGKQWPRNTKLKDSGRNLRVEIPKKTTYYQFLEELEHRLLNRGTR